MVAGEEPIIPECTVLNNDRYAKNYNPEGKLQQTLCLHRRTVLLIVPFVLVTITLTVALIIVATTRVQSCNLNNKEKTANSSSNLPAVADTIKVLLPDPCPGDWVWYTRKCYYFSEEDKTWADSLEFCKLHNASLVIIESRRELKFLFRHKGSEANHWIGLKSTDDNTGWIWVNGRLHAGDIFPTPKFASKTQYVYLNKKDVNAQTKIFENHWICSKPAFSDDW